MVAPISALEGILEFLLDEMPNAVEPLQVAEGFPDDGGAADSLWIMAAAMDQEDVLVPRLTTEEEGSLHLWLMVGIEGGSAGEVRRRAFGHATRVKAFVKTNPSLGDTVCPTALAVPVSWTPGVLKDANDNWIGRDGVFDIELRWRQDGLTY